MVDLTKYLKHGLTDMKPSAILAFANYASQFPDMVKFTVGEPDFNTPDHIKEAAIQGIKANHSHYALSNGIAPLREAASKFLAEQYGQHYDPKSEILVTNGVTEAIFACLMTVMNPGDLLLAPTPIFPQYFADAKLFGCDSIMVDTSESGFKLTPAQLQAAIDQAGERLRVLVLNNPNNPTGVVYTQAELDALADVVRDKPIFVLSHEIYSELNYDVPHASIAHALPEQTIVMNCVSKSWAMTGYRIGIMCAPAAITKEMAKINQLILTSAPTPMQDAAAEAFANGQADALAMKAEFKQRRDYLYQALTELGFKCVKPGGAFYIFAKIPAGYQQDDV
jgi:aspartate/methionine/tyrosine aminotransferase